MIIETKRLLLREWEAKDLVPFLAMNQNPQVLEHLPGPVANLEEAQAIIDRLQAHIKEHGFGPWATELKETGEFIGWVGLYIPRFEAHFTPCVEIGWRLDAPYWGKGYATEAAKAVLEAAFTKFRLKEVVSFTVPANVRSIRVMEKIGLKRDLQGDFEHPKLPEGHRLRKHVLYKISGEEFLSERNL